MSNKCVTNAESSQNNSITTREMCDAAVTKVRLDRVQFISRASIPFSLPHSTIVHGELWNEIRGWALHSWDCWAESCFCSLIGTFITSDTSTVRWLGWKPELFSSDLNLSTLEVSLYQSVTLFRLYTHTRIESISTILSTVRDWVSEWVSSFLTAHQDN